MEKIKVLCEKYRELLLYVVFGGLTTLVSFVSYWIFADGFHIHYMASTVLSWIVSVTFA
ncbi:MAG: GtrA family protein [Butyricicoccus sp.]